VRCLTCVLTDAFPLAGALGGIGTVMLVDKWEALYEWVVLYDSAAA
jgi:hypothetical protein